MKRDTAKLKSAIKREQDRGFRSTDGPEDAEKCLLDGLVSHSLRDVQYKSDFGLSIAIISKV